MKTIIVPIDFSDESLTGLDLALLLADRTGAQIQMVHVLTGTARLSHGEMKEKQRLAKVRFEELLQNYADRLKKNIKIDYIIKEGKIFREVNNQADSYEDPALVLSTHGGSGFEELFIGSNAYKIVSTAHKPVITVRNCKQIEDIGKIVLPLDITSQTREKVPYTAGLAKIFNSEIHIVTLATRKVKSLETKLKGYSEQVVSYLKTHQIPFRVDHLYGSNLTDITLGYAESVNADLISIMTEQEKSASNLLLGNYAHQMINKASIPVLSFPTYQIGIIMEDIRTSGVFTYNT